MNKEDIGELQRDIALTDLLLRVRAMETILIKKNVMTEQEFGEVLTDTLSQISNVLKSSGNEELANLLKINKETK